jgi:hypothetical protein
VRCPGSAGPVASGKPDAKLEMNLMAKTDAR